MPSSSLAAMTWHPSRDLHAQTPGCDACPPALQRALLTKAVINTHPSSGIQPTAWSQLHPGHVLQVQQPGQAAPRGARFSQAIREVQHIVFVVSRLRQEVIEPRVLHAAAHSGSARNQWQCGAGALRRRTSTTTWHVEHASEPSQAPAHHAEHQQGRWHALWPPCSRTATRATFQIHVVCVCGLHQRLPQRRPDSLLRLVLLVVERD